MQSKLNTQNRHHRDLVSWLIAFILCAFAQTALAQDTPPDPLQPPAPGTLPPVPSQPGAAPPGAGAPGTGGAQAPPSPFDSPPINLLSGFLDPFEYDSRGRRDPFTQPIEDRPAAQGPVHGPLLPLQKFDLTQIQLIGIIWDVARPKAMLRDPSGTTHIVGPNTKIGPRNGYIAVIREGEMVVVETIDRDGKLNSTSQVVKIAK